MVRSTPCLPSVWGRRRRRRHLSHRTTSSVRPSDCRSFSNGGLPSATAAMDRGSSRSPAPSTTAAAARPPSPSPSATSSAPDHPRQHGPALDVRSSRSPAPFATATKKKAASPAPSKKKVAKKKAVLPVPSATLPPPKVPSSLPLFLRPRWSQLSSYLEPPHGLKSISLTTKEGAPRHVQLLMITAVLTVVVIIGGTRVGI